MGRIEMTCNCDDIWLQDWLPIPNTSCFDNTIILCRIEDNVRTIMDMTKESLGWLQDTYTSYSMPEVFFFLTSFKIGLTTSINK
jgi:hypothetical protein